MLHICASKLLRVLVSISCTLFLSPVVSVESVHPQDVPIFICKYSNCFSASSVPGIISTVRFVHCIFLSFSSLWICDFICSILWNVGSVSIFSWIIPAISLACFCSAFLISLVEEGIGLCISGGWDISFFCRVWHAVIKVLATNNSSMPVFLPFHWL